MNAIVGLCHFCEAHGPRPLFCTFTTDNENNTTESVNSSVQCNGCSSLGSETVYVSRDDDGTIYCSRESVANTDVTAFLRQAAIRSITCEVSWSKEGGVVYFSDARGHVLSFTFQLKDTRARGLQRWFSIIVLMKDKMQLLNIMPFLSENMEIISKELKEMAESVFDSEQKVYSQRALRLNTGRNDFGQSRSLIQLTGNEDIFKKLHSQFTWLLKTGALRYSEKLYTTKDLMKRLIPQEATINHIDNACTALNEEWMSIRDLERLLTKTLFRTVLYCMLVGININIKLSHTNPKDIVNGLSRLVPGNKKLLHVKIVESIDADAAVCFLEETGNKFCVKWSGTLPMKCPTLMNKIDNSICNIQINDSILHLHVETLLGEWLGISKAVKSAIKSSGPNSDAVKNLKTVFGMTDMDNLLLNFWMSAYCD